MPRFDPKDFHLFTEVNGELMPDDMSIPALVSPSQLGRYIFVESRAGQRPAESWAFGVALHLGWKLEDFHGERAEFTATRFDFETCADVEIALSITMTLSFFEICIENPRIGCLPWDLKDEVFHKAVAARRAGNMELAEQFDRELDSICFDYNYRHIDEIQWMINKMLTKAKLMEK